MTLPLVGRDRELRELAALLADTRLGHGALAVVSGTAGIGKTALLAEVEALANAAGTPTLRGRAVADEGAPQFWPWLQVLEQGRGLGLDPGSVSLGPSPPAQARFLAVARASAALLDAAPAAGLLVVLDDLHWADQSSWQLLRHLSTDLAASRLLVVAATRDLSGLAAAAGPSGIRSMALASWSRADVSAYGQLVIGRPIAPSWASYLHRSSSGIPLFVRELVRELQQSGGLDGPATEPGVPGTVRPMLVSRLDSVTAESRELLGAASVLGEEFDRALLAAVVGRDAEQLSPALAEAVAAGILVAQSERPDELGFEHSLMRRASYDELSSDLRSQWHARAAATLADRPGSDRQLGIIAGHRIRAATDPSSRRTGMRACQSAAASALAAGQYEDAAHWYRRSIEIADTTDSPAAERAALALGLAEAEFALLHVDAAVRHSVICADLAEEAGQPDLGARAALVVRGIGGAKPNRIVIDLCRRARDRLNAGEDVFRARLLAQEAMALVEVADEEPDASVRERAQHVAGEAWAMAERIDDRTALVDALHVRERRASGPNAGVERVRLGEQLRQLGRVPERSESLMWAHLWRIDGFLHDGAVAEADAEIAGLADLAEGLGWPVARWQLLRARAARAMLAGRFAEAEQLAGAGKELATQCGDSSMLGQYYAYRLDIQRKTGQFDAADTSALTRIADTDPRPILLAVAAEYLWAAGASEAARILFARLVPTLPNLPENIQQPAILAIAGELGAAFGDSETVAGCFRRLRPYAGVYQASSNGYRGAFDRPLAVMAEALGDLEQAEHHFTAAAAMERRVGAPADLALTELVHARALRHRPHRRDRERAERLARSAVRTSARLGMSPALAQATQLLHELVGVDTADVGALTAREREIAELVADGLTNQAIAQRLVISDRTVESHVRNLTAKLGLTNRTQVAARIVRADLRDRAT